MPQDSRLTMNLPELAALIGVGRSSVYQAALRNELPVPVIRIGRRLVVPRSAVEALLQVGSGDSSLSHQSGRPVEETMRTTSESADV